jgi:hypothetical protein
MWIMEVKGRAMSNVFWNIIKALAKIGDTALEIIGLITVLKWWL